MSNTLCFRCLAESVHPDMGKVNGLPPFCRECGEREGHDYAFVTRIDHDKLRAKLGDKLAAEVIHSCRADWERGF